jgi:O-antigen/teichoic acid export membrane protein
MTNNPFSKSNILNSSFIMMASTFVSYFGGLAATILIARTLEPSEYGHYSYLIWLSSLVMIAANNGVNVSALRFISECIGKGKSDEAKNIGGWLRKRYYASVVLVVIFVIGWLTIHHPERWGQCWPLFVAAVLLSGIGKSGYLFVSSIAKGYGIFSIEATTTNVFSVANLIGVVVLFQVKAPMTHFFLLFVATSVGHWVLTTYLSTQKQVTTSFGAIPTDLQREILLHYRWAIVLTLISFLSNKSIEIYLLGLYSSPESIGYFTLGAGLVKAGTDLMCAGITTVLMPMMAFSFGQDGLEKVKSLLVYLIRIYFILGLLISGGSFFIAKPLIAIFFAPSFFPVELTFQIMGVIAGLTLIEVPLFTFLSTTNNQKFRVLIVIASLSLTATAAMLLIPKCGLLGALWGHAISRIVFILILMFGVSLKFKVKLPAKVMAKTFIAAALAGSLGQIVSYGIPSQFKGISETVLYCVTFIGLLLAFKVVTKAELDSIKVLTLKLVKKVRVKTKQ